MSVTDVRRDAERLTMTVTSVFAAPPERVWQMWENPRCLERWWGPPTYPATFVAHDLTVGGSMAYFMTGPEGDTPRGWWRILAVDAPHGLEFENGFADAEGRPDPTMPTMVVRMRLEAHDGGTRMEVETTFTSLETMEQLVTMGIEEGMTEAVGQIDALLMADAAQP